MAWDFKPGMRVVCISRKGWNASIARYTPSSCPAFKGVYTITALRPSLRGDGGLMLILKEFGRNEGWHESGFRPVREANIDSLRAHLAPRPLVRERA